MSHIINAREYARNAHKDQKRKWTNEPYFVHPERVALAVLERPDSTEDMVAAAYMHDVPEDIWAPLCESQYEWDVKWNTFACNFNITICGLVKGLTNWSKQTFLKDKREVRKKVDLDYLARQNTTVHILKLEDRYDNVLDMVSYPGKVDNDFLKVYEKETLALLEVIGYADKQLAQMIRDLFRYPELMEQTDGY